MAERDSTQTVGWMIGKMEKDWKSDAKIPRSRFNQLAEAHGELISRITAAVYSYAMAGDREAVLFFGLAMDGMISECSKALEKKLKERGN